ncbi:DUF6624 domain-containing protein [Phycicoccus avicenniae]|uniref:DUF6624 domain-containing protein n=1 Tax=Phycicoccus avicenniae TaxID=2828860 RepID=UPI003D2CC23E
MPRVGRTATAGLACALVPALLASLAAGCSTRRDDLRDAGPTRPPSSAPATPAPTGPPDTPEPAPTGSPLPAPAPAVIEKPPTTAPVEEPALRTELLAMLVQDQAVRTGVAPPGDSRSPDELAAAWDETDRRHGERMHAVLDEHGWPGWRLVGSDGAFAAFVLVQHADLDLPLQQRGLELLTAAVGRGDADPSDLAYLLDRVRVATGQPQVYGTQWGSDATGAPAPRTPIEDFERVDVRRAAVGLGTLAAYLEELAAAS